MKSKIVKIVWRDISGITSPDNSSAWFDKEQIVKLSKELYNHEYHSVGEIVYHDNDLVVLAATTDNSGLYSDASMIMKSVIIRIEELE